MNRIYSVQAIRVAGHLTYPSMFWLEEAEDFAARSEKLRTHAQFLARGEVHYLPFCHEGRIVTRLHRGEWDRSATPQYHRIEEIEGEFFLDGRLVFNRSIHHKWWTERERVKYPGGWPTPPMFIDAYL